MKSCLCGMLVLSMLGAHVALGQFTEVPETVRPGEWLMETDVASIAFDRHTPARDGVHFRSTYLGYVQVSTGLAVNLDVQVGLDSWREERASGAGVDERVRGVGELYLRAKWQFLQHSDFSAAVLPYVRVRQTADKDLRPSRTQYGVITPWEHTLSEQWSVGGQFQWEWLDDGAGGRDGWVTTTLVAHRAVSERFGFYFEAMSYFAPSAERRWSTLAGGGVTWQVTENFAWDAGVLVGVTRTAPDWCPALRFIWSL